MKIIIEELYPFILCISRPEGRSYTKFWQLAQEWSSDHDSKDYDSSPNCMDLFFGSKRRLLHQMLAAGAGVVI